MAEGLPRHPQAEVEDWPPLPLWGLHTLLTLSPVVRIGHLSSLPWQSSGPSPVLSSERFILLLVAGSSHFWGPDPVLRRPGAQYALPTQALGTTQSTCMGSGGHPCSHHPRKDHSGGTQPGRGRSVGTRGRWPKCKEVRRSGPWPAPREPHRERGVLARKTGHRRGKSSRSCATRRPAPLLWRTSGGAPAPRQRAGFPPLAPAQPPRTHSWRGTPLPHPGGARAALTWRTGRCHAPAGCGSPPASSAGSARAPGAPCSPGDAGR